MDGGIGEAALMSAVIGGGTAAITGGDPLKGALMGGLTGGAMGAFGGLSGVDSLAAQARAADLANAGVTGSAATSGVGSIPLAPGVNPAVAQIGAGQVAADAANLASMGTNGLTSMNASITSPAVANAQGLGNAAATNQPFSLARGMDIVKANPWTFGGIAASQALPNLMKPPTSNAPAQQKYEGPLSRFRYDPSTYQPDVVVPPSPAYRPVYAAGGGLMDGGNQGIAGLSANPNFPMADQQTSRYAVPSQMPVGATDVRMAHMAPTSMAAGGLSVDEQGRLAGYEPATDTYTGQELTMRKGGNPLQELLKSRDAIDSYRSKYSSDPGSVAAKAKGGDYNAMLALNDIKGTPNQNYAHGGISSLGGYSDGGRMLKGPGDGMSDSIPASISGKQPARLADGEFVVPADVVSHLGNGSTDAGAKRLYSMMDKVRQARTGKKKQARAINPNKMMPA